MIRDIALNSRCGKTTILKYAANELSKKFLCSVFQCQRMWKNFWVI
eukprot:TRINITY_DN6473_c0_g1_i1.p2 TRINITY_DN6473_c0_g1~~TRINITY_DN6473_c0_g1_i1.p2  ORF type:complete len:54 (-),score=5.69 TRINITY_DN6473_c0_g1_i1:161-298(-)